MTDEQSPRLLAALDWPWQSEDCGIGIILVSDEQLINLARHPDEAVEKVHPQADAPVSLREHCRRGAQRGATKLRLAFDYFFGGSKRSLYPDTETFQEALAQIHRVAQEYGLGLEPSILSPLELGVGYRSATGESGRWMHYREGLRDPGTGTYSVAMWQHKRWCNNKGPTPVALCCVRAFAFREQRIPGTPFFAVDPDEIAELAAPEVEQLGSAYGEGSPGVEADARAQFGAVRVRIHGHGDVQVGPLDRVLVVLVYRTLEMDYLSPSASAFLRDLVEQYHDRGISPVGLYSDEMHIQQDWSYHAHLENGQFAMRYVSPGLERAFADRFGARYADFAKYLIYFACHQHSFSPTHEPKLPSQHAFGPDLQGIHDALLFRRNYYDLLEHSVVQLMVDARQELERLCGYEMDAFYHATWAESPTCDAWAVGSVHQSWSPEEHCRRYEYTPEFLWSNTVQQAAAACANYFAWNEFLTGGNDDTAEGGYADRNYYGRALACSLAALNRRPLASAGMWGMPAPVRERMLAVSETFGAGGHAVYRSVQGYAPRQIEALFLYPQDLVAVDERFGSWMVQYGYANYVTAEKLVEYGRVTENGELAVRDARYRTVCALYEPFPNRRLVRLLTDFVRKGGTVVWTSIPPLSVLPEGGDASRWIADLFGAQIVPTSDPLGLALPARQVRFYGPLASVGQMAILTDLVVDRVFPVQPLQGAERVAWLRTGGVEEPLCVGVRRTHPSGGQALYLGFRPRDDQAASLGVETRVWFEVLNVLGAYPSTGVGAGEDNPSVVSRTTDYLACAFPNGAIALCPHYRHHQESWLGGFFRDVEEDRRVLAENPLPDDEIQLQHLRVAGHVVTYQGRHAVAWRLDGAGQLIAFAGLGCGGIALDGRAFSWAQEPVDVAWHPLWPEHETPVYRPLYRVWCRGKGRLSLPLGLVNTAGLEVWLGAPASGGVAARQAAYGRAGYGVRQMPVNVDDGKLTIDAGAEIAGHWLYVVRRKE